MNLKTLLGLSFIFFVALGCVGAKFTGETIKHKTVPSGQISVISGGYGKTKVSSVNNAIDKAFRNILLHGIPGTNQSTPMLGSTAEKVYQQNKKAIENILSNDLERYILDREVSAYRFLNINTPSTEVRLLINLQAFRSRLESQGIIRKFGI